MRWLWAWLWRIDAEIPTGVERRVRDCNAAAQWLYLPHMAQESDDPTAEQAGRAACALLDWLLDISHEGGDIDSWEMWEAMVRLGLATPEPYDPERHGEDFPGEPEPGTEIFVLTPLGHKAASMGGRVAR